MTAAVLTRPTAGLADDTNVVIDHTADASTLAVLLVHFVTTGELAKASTISAELRAQLHSFEAIAAVRAGIALDPDTVAPRLHARLYTAKYEADLIAAGGGSW